MSARQDTPPAPSYESLPERQGRTARGGPAIASLSVAVKVVTPILGGGSETRAIDDVDIIRPATVRGHLRFWWRALHGHEFANARDLYEAESGLWGRAATDEGGRSAVQVRIDVEKVGAIDSSDIRLYDSKDGKATPGAYALWPAREEKKNGNVTKPAAPRRLPGTQFRLRLTTAARFETQVKNALRAWILFGGYGSRTRRGLGSLTAAEDASTWLPTAGTREALTTFFERDIFAPPSMQAVDTPQLAGAALHIGKADGDAMKAWTIALEWLKDFRQGTNGGPGERARESGTGKPQPNRPSISNWPEPDKIRHLTGKKGAHPPRHNSTPAWPRAAFGLPIIGGFQTESRTGGTYDEPGPFELRWRSGNTEHDRLASPLIVKAMPLADGTFVPCALWLNRTYPSNGQVGLARPKRGGKPNEKEVDPNTTAPFDCLVAPGDTPRFSALANQQSLRQAFLAWLQAKYRTTVVAP